MEAELVGDVLFSLGELWRFLKINPENAPRTHNKKIYWTVFNNLEQKARRLREKN